MSVFLKFGRLITRFDEKFRFKSGEELPNG